MVYLQSVGGSFTSDLSSVPGSMSRGYGGPRGFEGPILQLQDRRQVTTRWMLRDRTGSFGRESYGGGGPSVGTREWGVEWE